MDIEDISVVKSSTGIAKLFAESLSNRLLEIKNETLPQSPSSFVSLITSAITDLAANSTLEQGMIKKELYKNTAIRLSSLLRYLTDEEIASIFAIPSSTTFSIFLQYDFLLKNAVLDVNSGSVIKKVTINKDSTALIMNTTAFILDYSININITNSNTDKPTFTVTYDTLSGSNIYSTINNPYINSRIITYKNKKYLNFEFIGRAYSRNETMFQINIDSNSDQLVSYSDQLMGFEVFYKSSSDKFTKLMGYPEGFDPVDGYNYSLLSKNDINYIKISFSKNPDGFNLEAHSVLKIVIYTTKGSEDNISFPNLDEDIENNLTFILKQDLGNPFEQPISTLTPMITTKSIESSGGKDQMTFEEIRKYVISKSSSNKIITPRDLDLILEPYGFSKEKIRHDVLNITYRIHSLLNDGNNNISSGMGIFRFNLNDIPIRNEIKSRIIKPIYVFKYSRKDGFYHYQKDPDSLIDYLDDYRNNRETQASYPFFIKIYFGDIIRSQVFDLSSDKYYFTNVEYYDIYALDSITIEKVYIGRNPINETPTEKDIEEGYEGWYTIEFNAIVGKNLYEIVKTEIEEAEIEKKEEELSLKFRLIIKSGTDKFYIDANIVDLDDNLQMFKMRSILITNNNINNLDQISITNNSIIPIPIPLIWENYYYLNKEIEIDIVVINRSEDMFKFRNVENDIYLKKSELENYYYIPIIYSMNPSVVLSTELSNRFNLILDLKINDSIYKTYEKDEYLTYTNTIYATDDKGETLYEEIKITNDLGETNIIKKPIILHNKGDIVYNDNNKPQIAHREGEIVYDSHGEPIQLKVNDYYCLIKEMPWYNRLFANNEKYMEILNSYLKKLDILNDISKLLLDQMNIILGLKKTSGQSNVYKIYNSKLETYEPLDNLAISLEFGVTLNSLLSDSEIDDEVELIRKETKIYIYNLTSNVFAISELFKYLKETITSIEYLEFYKINNYDSTVCQSIHKSDNISTVDDEILCVKMDIDEENSDFNNGKLVFEPAIKIKVI